jgi:hypothetical protein
LDEIRPIQGLYTKNEQLMKFFISELKRYDEIYPPGVTFIVDLRSARLTGAPELHFLVFAIDLEFQKRLIVFENEFTSGEGRRFIDLGILDKFASPPKTLAPVRLICNEVVCSVNRPI